MRITAITRYKHGELYGILKRLGWTQSELARRTEIQPSRIGEIINLVRRPSEAEANKIQKAVGEAGEYLDVLGEWPESFGLTRGLKIEQTADVPMERLLDHPEILELPAPETEDGHDVLLSDALESEMTRRLSRRQKAVIKARFFQDRTLENIGDKLNLSREQVRNIEAKALRLLRGPTTIRKLKEGMEAL